ncbi:MAG: EAL domain-containing protein, partial [Bacilli bacterium]|nr:EAL domain-containing protein [Bacilli bacterium]
GIKISINITGTTVVTADFIELVEEMNKEYDFAHNNICIEVTEKEDLPFNDDNLNALRRIVDTGLVLAIDDFSMGQTSINYLKYDLFSIIKIDGGLVKGLTTSSNCREIIASISKLAESLDMKVIAEFVQTEEEREILHNIGVDYFQGYLYSPAKPLNEK